MQNVKRKCDLRQRLLRDTGTRTPVLCYPFPKNVWSRNKPAFGGCEQVVKITGT